MGFFDSEKRVDEYLKMTEGYDGLLFTKHQINGLKEIIGDNFDILLMSIYTEIEKGDSIYVVLRK